MNPIINFSFIRLIFKDNALKLQRIPLFPKAVRGNNKGEIRYENVYFTLPITALIFAFCTFRIRKLDFWLRVV